MINLIRRLPRDSELSRETAGEAAEWSREDHLLAILADRIAELTWVTVCANSDEQPDRPTPISRPGLEEPESELPSSPAAQASFFAS